MRLSWWVPLAALLSLATAQPQDTLASLGTVTHAKNVGGMSVEERNEPEHRGPNIETGGALEAMVAALSAASEAPPPTEEPVDASQSAPAPDNQQEGQQQQGGEEAAGGVPAEGTVAERDSVPSLAAEGQKRDPAPVETTEGLPEEEETPTVAAKEEEPAIPAPPLPSPTTTTSQEKVVEKYNEMSDQVVDILIQTIDKVDPLPIELTEEALTALEDLQDDPAPVPETEPESQPEPSVNRQKKKKKNKNRNKNRRNKDKRGESTRDVEPEVEEEGVEGVEEGEENNNNKKGKNNKRGDEDDSETEEAEGEKKGNKNKKNKRKNKKNKRGGGNDDSEDEGNSRRNKNKRKNNKNKQNRGDDETKRRNKNRRKNNKNKNNNNKRTSKIGDVEIERQGKAMTDLQQEEGEEVVQEQGRRVKNKNNNNNKRNNKRKNNKNKKNKRKNQKGRTDLIEEAVAETGPVYPTQEERDTSNAILKGLTRISRQGDVTLDRNGNRDMVTLHAVVGPLKVQLSQMGRALTKAEVTAELNADITFKIRTKGRRMQLIKVRDVSVGELTSANINVARSDLVLEDDVINEAKNQVLSAVDVARVGRIINSELEAIFSVDDVVQNLPHHSLLQQQTQEQQH
ncbi:hypothetical protein Pmani_038940 [Petrolisthes manimaculis]|uniref:Uncharacterized protein n=1 Tax=Petrolisthes manimaculis TaxID=1843537 RepID=A0AAE1TLT7_9EUCA|nr:hypothetical protein Pmani_038940 [Petrolisthes manimaculis]